MEQEQSSRCSLEGPCKMMLQSIEKEINVYYVRVLNSPKGQMVIVQNYGMQELYSGMNNQKV